ncbi:MAG: ATP-binding protein [Promethearchaeota archaeon]
MPSNRIKSLINEYNPWWEGKTETITVPKFKRTLFALFEKFMKTKQIIAIIGLRRVGKTIMMRQMINKLIKKGTKNIFYFLFDDIITQTSDILDDILQYYLKTINTTNEQKYIFLDEIQKVQHWQDILKRYYDTREDIKFIVSGSASLNIMQCKESLAGRIFDIYLPPLTFREFLNMNRISVEIINLKFSEIQQFYNKNINKIVIYEQMLEKYLLKGAFPEIATEEDIQIIFQYIKSSVIDHILLGDIPLVYDVRRKDLLYSLLEYCCKETSNMIEFSKLAKILGANNHTIKEYIYYLKDAFLLDLIFNYSGSIAKQLRKSKKMHIIHPCISITMLRYDEKIMRIEELAGKFIETIIFLHARLLSERISFWRTPQKHEVDIILESTPLLPIEVKYRNYIENRDFKGLIKFMENYDINEGIMVSKNLLEKKLLKGKIIYVIPAWLFLLAF